MQRQLKRGGACGRGWPAGLFFHIGPLGPRAHVVHVEHGIRVWGGVFRCKCCPLCCMTTRTC